MHSDLPQGSCSKRLVFLAGALATFVIAIVILILSLVPSQEAGSGSDVEGHILAYAALTFPLACVCPTYAPWIFVASFALGGSIELVQPLVGRYAEWHDVFANVVGATTGILLGSYAGYLFRKMR
ncbi:MAG: VanZ family protein [Bradyrhizobiaceae bacterium]|nr:VanZ family protein [Bradyrhizobiaceae bacterium]